MNFGTNQSNAILKFKVDGYFSKNLYGSIKNANESEMDYIRESIMQDVMRGQKRITIDRELIVFSGNRVISMVTEDDQVIFTGSYGGSEEYDGEDTGVYRFFMNKSSLQGKFKETLNKIPKIESNELLKSFNG